MTELFFALLRDALWHDEINGVEFLPHELLKAESAEVLNLARKQAVFGLVVDALFRNDVRISENHMLKCIRLLKIIKQQVKMINHGVIELHHLFSQEGIDYSVVKGQVIAAYYPDALLRYPGDIDYYCSSINFEKAQKVIEKRWGITFERQVSRKHVCFVHDDIIYEGHFALLTLYGKKERAYWNQLIDSDKGETVAVDGVEIRTFSPTVHTLYIFMHLYNHLIKLGVGLRQFCDLAVMLHYASKRIDMDVLRGHLKALSMEKAWCACGSILVDYLGLPESNLGYVLSDKDRKYGKRILDVVLYRGNMGHFEGKQLRIEKEWEWKMKAVCIKLSHFMKFAPLAPSYSCGWLWYEFKRSL